MGLPAARVGDPHVCPMVTGIVPHVGGPVLPPCSINVLTGKMPQARVGDLLTCVGPPDVFMMGSMGVFVNYMPATRALMDTTAHGGRVLMGCPTVLIGDTGGGGGGAGSMSSAGVSAGQSRETDALASAAAYMAPWKQAFAYKSAAKTGAPFCERCT